jgi:hypothetical protein
MLRSTGEKGRLYGNMNSSPPPIAAIALRHCQRLFVCPDVAVSGRGVADMELLARTPLSHVVDLHDAYPVENIRRNELGGRHAHASDGPHVCSELLSIERQ